MRIPNTLILIFTLTLTTNLLPTSTAQIVQQLSDGQIQVPTSIAPIDTAPAPPASAPKLAVPTPSPSAPPLPAPIESATTVAPSPSPTAAAPPPPPPTLAAETTAPIPPPPSNEAAETLPSPSLVPANISVTCTSTSSCAGTGSGSGTLVAGNTSVPTVPSVPSVAAPAPTEEGPSEAGTTAPRVSNGGTRSYLGGFGGALVGLVLLWSL